MKQTPRYFRCTSPDSYFEVRGEQVIYYAPQCPKGGVSMWTLADMERCAAKRPATDGEINGEELEKIRARLAESLADWQRREADAKALAATRFRDVARAEPESAAKEPTQGVLFGGAA